MNQPERHECYVLEEDETKVKYKPDTKIVNAGAFTILKEDHTLGNLIRMQLLADKTVVFAGYRIPHPLFYELSIKIRTNGAKNCLEAMNDSVSSLIETTQYTQSIFEDAVQKKIKSQSGHMGIGSISGVSGMGMDTPMTGIGMGDDTGYYDT